mmetsp:Transcript_5417/g.10831  ORF Transcript_5417/g.10831 Transcript_5417/m.10831 type:complete len:220 (-) Transcript_5417:172-831(-)
MAPPCPMSDDSSCDPSLPLEVTSCDLRSLKTSALLFMPPFLFSASSLSPISFIALASSTLPFPIIPCIIYSLIAFSCLASRTDASSSPPAPPKLSFSLSPNDLFMIISSPSPSSDGSDDDAFDLRREVEDTPRVWAERIKRRDFVDVMVERTDSSSSSSSSTCWLLVLDDCVDDCDVLSDLFLDILRFLNILLCCVLFVVFIYVNVGISMYVTALWALL